MEEYMRRALELATLGRGQVSPNPMVGCVIVHDGNGPNTSRIIGEGWHRQYGDWHAEVNAVRSVHPNDAHLLPESTVYVTLEPCSHWGKTPPCADLLIDKRVKRVVCCNNDPNPLVAGQGFARLRAAGIEVETGLLEPLGRALNARFFTFFEQKRPYIILKWAETADGFVGAEGGKPVKISGELAHRLVHRWRSEEDAILVGKHTALNDNPRLNTRLWPGKNPVRIVLDRRVSLPASLALFDGSQETLVYHQLPAFTSKAAPANVTYAYAPTLEAMLNDLQMRKRQSVLVEGGPTVLNALLDAGLWDEMRVFRSRMLLGKGIQAPVVRGMLQRVETIGTDELAIYTKA